MAVAAQIRVRRVVDEGRECVKAGRELPELTAEGVVGAAFGVIYARLIEGSEQPLIGLLGPLMAMIVLPYRGVPNAWHLTPRGGEIVSLSADRGVVPSDPNEGKK
jgi:hypothetical protein